VQWCLLFQGYYIILKYEDPSLHNSLQHQYGILSNADSLFQFFEAQSFFQKRGHIRKCKAMVYMHLTRFVVKIVSLGRISASAQHKDM
jgi:hypothetical protein